MRECKRIGLKYDFLRAIFKKYTNIIIGFMQNVVFKLGEEKSFLGRLDRFRVFNPINVILLGYFILIFLGAIILMLPYSTVSGHISFTDALFTSTSAATVTGLVVKETGTYFTFFGQMAIFFIIQIGGLGYMSLVGFFILKGGERISFEHRLLLRETINSPTVKGIRKMAKRIFLFIVGIELIGALIFVLRWLPEYGLKAIWNGIFHSIASFNNAGFDIISTGNKFESLAMYTTDITINLTTAALIILGGIGFYVLSDIYRFVKGKKQQLSYQTKVVCLVTFLLLVVGTIFFFVSEYYNPTLERYGLGNKLLISFFNSVTPRTAGFSTVPVASFSTLTLLGVIALMFIGASPGGTGGGIKTTTIAIFWAYLKKCVQGRKNINLISRRITEALLDRAVAITFLGIIFIGIISFIIAYTSKLGFLEVVFETTSAFGTVGLTMSLTPYLSVFAKYLIMLTMFSGKIGVLTLILFFVNIKKKPEVVLPSGELTT